MHDFGLLGIVSFIVEVYPNIVFTSLNVIECFNKGVTRMTNIEKYTQAFMDAFSIDAETAKTLQFQQIPAWDSVGHMGLIAQLEEQFGIMMEPDDIVDLSSYEKGKEITGLDQVTDAVVFHAGTKLQDGRFYTNGGRVLGVTAVAPTLRGWEGQASHIYFNTINRFLPEEFRFERRSQHPALDVTNAFLNYGYGLLYSKIESALIKAGIDPYIGILHRDDYNRPVMVYDVIEIYRVWVDYIVYTLIAQNCITDDYYSVREDGSFWLESLGRR